MNWRELKVKEKIKEKEDKWILKLQAKEKKIEERKKFYETSGSKLWKTLHQALKDLTQGKVSKDFVSEKYQEVILDI